MSLTFDGANRVVVLAQGVTTLEVKDLYSRWKDWAAEGDNLRFLPAFRVVGGDATVGANAVASYYFLTNGWRVRPQEAHHTLTIAGILLGEEGAEVFADTLGTYRIRIVQIVPLQAETITVVGGGGGNGTSLTAGQIAAAVLNAPAADHDQPGTIGRILNRVLTMAKYLAYRNENG